MNIHMKLLVASGEKQLKLHRISTTYIHSWDFTFKQEKQTFYSENF